MYRLVYSTSESSYHFCTSISPTITHNAFCLTNKCLLAIIANNNVWLLWVWVIAGMYIWRTIWKFDSNDANKMTDFLCFCIEPYIVFTPFFVVYISFSTLNMSPWRYWYIRITTSLHWCCVEGARISHLPSIVMLHWLRTCVTALSILTATAMHNLHHIVFINLRLACF